MIWLAGGRIISNKPWLINFYRYRRQAQELKDGAENDGKVASRVDSYMSTVVS